jgi:hypothetical protein
MRLRQVEKGPSRSFQHLIVRMRGSGSDANSLAAYASRSVTIQLGYNPQM